MCSIKLVRKIQKEKFVKGINQEFIDEVLSKNDIVDVVSRYATLSRRGNNYWACCPFHMEKTPSMSVKQDGQFFKCFGCGEGGNAISFLMKIENIEFLHALEILCKNAGMQMPTLEESNEMIAKKKLRDRLLNVVTDTCVFYRENLKNPKAKSHVDYINRRGLNAEMQNKFMVGASLDFDSLPRFLKSKGYSFDEMVQAGVVGLGDNGNYYDFYGGRVIFPIFNGLNEVVGFSGRDISNNPEKAKYSVYSLKYPFMRATGGDFLLGLVGKSNDYKLSFNDLFIEDVENKPREAFVWAETIEDTEESITSTTVRYNKMQFQKVGYSFTVDGVDWKGIMLVTPSKEGFYVITIEAAADAWDANYKVMEQMLSDFRMRGWETRE